MHRTRPACRAACVAAALLAIALAAACGSSPVNPSPAPSPEWREIETFGEFVGTNWTGTARFDTGGASAPASFLFLWGGVCDIPGWCAQGYHPLAWGTTGGVRTRIFGYQLQSGYWRALDVGEQVQGYGGTPEGSGHWDAARVSGDGQRLVIVSSDFSWGQRRGVTYDLAPAPWPASFPCPNLVSCTPR